LDKNGYSQLDPQDSVTFMISTDAVFVLRAFNGDQQVLRTVEVRLRHAVPVSPYNLIGQVVAGSGTMLTWAYDVPSAIVGFRVYRNSGSGYVLIAAEDQLNNSVRQYLDLSAGNCMTYYVVAVYQNTSGQWLETTSSNQWQSTCP
jgi:hypothetical protein